MALELLVIGAEDEWERIHMGPIQESAVIEARSRLRRLKLEAEHRHFPDGLELPSPLMALAIQETSRYLRDMYGRETGA